MKKHNDAKEEQIEAPTNEIPQEELDKIKYFSYKFVPY